MKDAAEFEHALHTHRPEYFMRYRGLRAEKEDGFRNVIDHLGIDLVGKRVLDVGPGHGDTLDVANERGARECHFIEIEPWFYHYNRLKGFTTAHLADFRLGFHRHPSNGFDLVWIKGASAADDWPRPRRDLLKPRTLRFITVAEWYADLERIVAPGGDIIVCPWWRNDEGRRQVEDFEQHPFTRHLHALGYKPLPSIASHNEEPMYPVTYHKRKPFA